MNTYVPDPKFYLKDCSSEVPTTIYMQVKYTGTKPERFMLSTGNKILPGEWDDVKQRAILSKRAVANADINLWLDKMSTAFKNAFRNFMIEGKIPTAQELRDQIVKMLNIKASTTTTESKIVFLSDFVEKFIENYKSLRAPNTIKAYISSCRRIKEFETLQNKRFHFTDINIEWRAQFIKHLQSLGITKNTEGKHIKHVKLFMNEAAERGLHSNLAFKSKSFSKPFEDVHKIFLTKDEIHKIANLDLSNDKLKDVIRDYFIIACLSSLRYSDFTRIRKENIRQGYLQIITAKTGQEVVIPISLL